MALVLPYRGRHPKVADGVFVAPNATLIGDVTLHPESNVWFGAVLRADVGSIEIGSRTNVQDGSCVHLTEDLSVTRVGSDVTIGHGVILHGCTVGDGCLIGMGSVILDNAVIGEGSVVAAGSLVPPRMVVPPRSLVRGSPAKVVREVNAGEASMGRSGAEHYVANAREYRAMLEGLEAQGQSPLGAPEKESGT